ncbi:polysaccharide transporter [Leptolyngbya sp. NK1-12]|uniref:Polysaccharide transporter n=1 Tax=Leptolyngbya sp. NK1-12 TaxID=2547451 RepID=A0AA97AH42_9CYAN|nr:polysaccharide transporter [Leptolyngbya sp. NK1-12]
MMRVTTKVQSAQRTQLLSFSQSKSSNKSSKVLLCATNQLCGATRSVMAAAVLSALLTPLAWAVSQAANAAQQPQKTVVASSLANSTHSTSEPAQPHAQPAQITQSQVPPSGAPTQSSPRRGVILTPSLPNRTIVPPPTSAFPFEEAYTLGPSDQIQIDIFDVPELSGATAGRYIVQLDGTINLIWAGPVKVQGLTLQQAEQAISQAYARFIRNPLVTVSLIETRSLRISVAGEVKRPGAYVISPEGATDNRILVEAGGAGGGVTNQWPTVTKALQAAGGITQFADLRRVQVRRPLTDGSLEIIDVNLWELLRTGELNQDIRLRDRDAIVIPTATTLNESEALVLGSANLSPETIRVNVIGEVSNPGVIEVSPNTPMNQALLAAGGFQRPRARTSKVELVRLSPNGTAIRRTVDVDLAAGINDQTNPALRDFDTIIVSRNGNAVFSDNLNSVLDPFDRFFGIFNTIFGTINTITEIGDE